MQGILRGKCVHKKKDCPKGQSHSRTKMIYFAIFSQKRIRMAAT